MSNAGIRENVYKAAGISAHWRNEQLLTAEMSEGIRKFSQGQKKKTPLSLRARLGKGFRQEGAGDLRGPWGESHI